MPEEHAEPAGLQARLARPFIVASPNYRGMGNTVCLGFFGCVLFIFSGPLILVMRAADACAGASPELPFLPDCGGESSSLGNFGSRAGILKPG